MANFVDLPLAAQVETLQQLLAVVATRLTAAADTAMLETAHPDPVALQRYWTVLAIGDLLGPLVHPDATGRMAGLANAQLHLAWAATYNPAARGDLEIAAAVLKTLRWSKADIIAYLEQHYGVARLGLLTACACTHLIQTLTAVLNAPADAPPIAGTGGDYLFSAQEG